MSQFYRSSLAYRKSTAYTPSDSISTVSQGKLVLTDTTRVQLNTTDTHRTNLTPITQTSASQSTSTS